MILIGSLVDSVWLWFNAGMGAILVVEDDQLLSKEIEKALTEAGYGVILAKDVTEAMEKIQANDVELIYLDVMLRGGQNGYEVLQKVKADEKFRKIAVVMCTNLGDIKDMDRAMEMGADDYIIKANIDIDKLVQIAKQHITGFTV
jgi:DNA-binding response OmpR family regulator